MFTFVGKLQLMNRFGNDNLCTPSYLIEGLGGLFDLDPCAGKDTFIAKKNIRYSDGWCGLKAHWEGCVFVNPPFSQKELWIDKFLEHKNGILLLPERGSAPWFGPLASACCNYFVFGKKVNFLGGASSNNVGTVLFPLGNEANKRIENSNLPGLFVRVVSFKPRS